jgi:RNA polymerase sigma-70 factor (ECF subfamily)
LSSTTSPSAPSAPSSNDAATSFEPHRRFLVGLAYRMLGSVAEAEDVAQDAFLRWNGADRASVAEPRAFLARTASRLCLDRMKSASAQRERYVGTWLPEPVVEAASWATPGAMTDAMTHATTGATSGAAAGAIVGATLGGAIDRGPHGAMALAEDISFALLMTHERLSPLERAAFLLHDVFDMEFRDIAEVLERSEAACRQLAARGRDHVRDERPRFETTPAASARLTDAFHAAMLDGNLPALAQLLADDVVLYTDGGGKRNAALNPVYGRDKILRFITGLAGKGWLPDPALAERVQINGNPGFVLHGDEGPETLAFEISADRIVALYGVRNPDKLRHLARDLEPRGLMRSE